MKVDDVFSSDLSHAEVRMSESVASLMMRARHAMQGTQRPTQCGQKKEKPAHLRTGASARQRQTGACLGVTTPTTNACLKHSNFLKQHRQAHG